MCKKDCKNGCPNCPDKEHKGEVVEKDAGPTGSEIYEFLEDLCVVNGGVATMSVSDGNIFMFKRKPLQKIFDDHPDQETFMVFVKKNEIKH